MVQAVGRKATFLHYAPLFPTNLKKGQHQKEESFVIFSPDRPRFGFRGGEIDLQILKNGFRKILPPSMFVQ
jgi:hypothetical protein